MQTSREHPKTIQMLAMQKVEGSSPCFLLPERREQATNDAALPAGATNTSWAALLTIRLTESVVAKSAAVSRGSIGTCLCCLWGCVWLGPPRVAPSARKRLSHATSRADPLSGKAATGEAAHSSGSGAAMWARPRVSVPRLDRAPVVWGRLSRDGLFAS
jgi:hypothetical protein